MNLPVVVLVGKPNVGKSTLFNRITKSKQALVADFPGLTRDRLYAITTFQSKSFVLVDTGGIGVEDEAIDELMRKQSDQAVQEADVVLFIVDGRAGLTSVDEAIARKLRTMGKSVHIVVNKVDGLDKNIALAEMQSLGFASTFGVSATHGHGIRELLLEVIPKDLEPLKPAADVKGIKLGFLGRPNVGKSTLINRMLGEERVVVCDFPGTTRDSIYIPFTRNEQAYVLIDTAGVRRRARVDGMIEKFSVIKTLQAIEDAAVCLMILDAQEGITDQDLHLIGLIVEAGKALVIVVNKWDGLENDHRLQVKEAIARRLDFIHFAKIRFISALHGSGVGKLFDDVDTAYESAFKVLSTPQLTRLLQDFVTQNPPPMVNGRRIKLKYAHAGGHNPPRIVIHGNSVDALPQSYCRYLTKAFAQKLHLVGTPICLELKASHNPFEGKKNQLTGWQIKKRQRLMKRVKK